MTDSLLRRHECSVAVVLIDKNFSLHQKENSDLRIPIWNETEVVFEADQKASDMRECNRELNKSRKAGISGRISTQPDDLVSFFENVYLPSIASSHGEAALPTSIERRLEQLSDGSIELVEMMRDGEVVGGTLIDYRKDVPALKEIGVLGGSAEIKKQGVITATNLFAMERVRTRGFERINFGLTRCYLNDGGMMYKRKFRPVVIGASDESFLFRFRNLDPAVRSMLRLGACVSWQAGKLSRTYFRGAPKPSAEHVKRAPRSEWRFGLESQTVYDVAGDQLKRVEMT